MINMDRVAVVTGGTRGIGFGIVNQLFKDGFKVACLGRRPNEDVEKLIDEAKGRVEFITTGHQ